MYKTKSNLQKHQMKEHKNKSPTNKTKIMRSMKNTFKFGRRIDCLRIMLKYSLFVVVSMCCAYPQGGIKPYTHNPT